MSFVDLMADHRWSEADIVNRTEAMVREYFTVASERILNRKMLGTSMGYVLSPEEQVELAQFQAVVLGAQAEGLQARADMALLAAALEVEAAQARLAQPAVQPVWQPTEEGDEVLVNQQELDADTTQRLEAQAVVDAASTAALDLVQLRALNRPAPEPAPEPEEPIEQPAEGGEA
jgi:hypothetical protein